MERMLKNTWVLTAALPLLILFCVPVHTATGSSLQWAITVTVIGGSTDYWQDDFIGTAGDQPPGWDDETDNNAFNAEIAYSSTTSWAAVTRTADAEVWGKVLSPTQTVDVAAYPMVEIVVTGISASTSWKLGIQEQEGIYSHWDLSGSQTGTGTFPYNYSTTTGWSSGTHVFSVEITVEGSGGTYIEADSVRIY